MHLMDFTGVSSVSRLCVCVFSLCDTWFVLKVRLRYTTEGSFLNACSLSFSPDLNHNSRKCLSGVGGREKKRVWGKKRVPLSKWVDIIHLSQCILPAFKGSPPCHLCLAYIYFFMYQPSLSFHKPLPSPSSFAFISPVAGECTNNHLFDPADNGGALAHQQLTFKEHSQLIFTHVCKEHTTRRALFAMYIAA